MALTVKRLFVGLVVTMEARAWSPTCASVRRAIRVRRVFHLFVGLLAGMYVMLSNVA